MNTGRNLEFLTPLEPLAAKGKVIIEAFSSYLSEEKLAKSFSILRKDDSRVFVSLYGFEIVIRVELLLGQDKGAVIAYFAEAVPPQGRITACRFDHLGNVFIQSGTQEFAETADNAAPMFVNQLIVKIMTSQTPLAASLKSKI